MVNVDFLVNTMRDALNVIHRSGLTHVFGQDIHFSPLYVEHSKGSTVVPLIELESEIYWESKLMTSRRRRDVFSIGDLVFKSGEIRTEEGYCKSQDNRSDPFVIASANLNLSIENRARLDNYLVAEQPVLLVYDGVNGVKYTAERKKLTLADLAGKYNPLIGESSGKILEGAAIRLYSILEGEGKVFVPRRKIDGKVDLGDILVNREDDGGLELRLTDHPSILKAEDCAMDNSQSFAMVLSAFYESMIERNPVSKISDSDVFVSMRNKITKGNFGYCLG